MPTATGICRRLLDHNSTKSTSWAWSRTTLWRCMAKIGLAFGERKTRYESARERDDKKGQRSSHARWVRRHRAEGCELFYQDEAWAFKNMAASKAWISDQNDFSYKARSGAGERSIASDVSSSPEGLLDGALLMRRGSKSSKSADCRTEMSSNAFLNWLQRKALPRL